MLIGACTVDLHLPGNGSLKSKRQILKGLKERIKKKFNVSISEIDHHDLWQRALLGVAVVSSDAQFAHQVLSKVVDFIRSERRVELIDYSVEIR
ncbi:MAG: DUF503 domain-containing protein [Gemmatimonadota bacterium]|nr:MAG: DUF503 domain-containing protein [Gemmatimonadota bacterium]